jgi:hypothetical protein
MFRRLLSSSARAATDLATSGSQSSSVASSVRTVDARLLPPALQNHIMREVDKQVAQANMYIRNPFVVHTFTCNVVG